MAMNFLRAMCYPFGRKQVVDVLLIPSLLTFAGMVCMTVLCILCLMLIHQQFSGMSYDDPYQLRFIVQSFRHQVLLVGPLFLGAGLLCSMVFYMPVMGYNWELTDRWQTQGTAMAAPTWRGNLLSFYKSGFQMALASLALCIPMALAAVPLGAGVPFLLGGFFLAAKDKTCASVLRNVKPGMQLALKQVGPVMRAFYLGVALYLAYMVLAGVPYVAAKGPVPFVLCMGVAILCSAVLTQAYLVTACCTLSQAFGLQAEVQPGMAFTAGNRAASMPNASADGQSAQGSFQAQAEPAQPASATAVMTAEPDDETPVQPTETAEVNAQNVDMVYLNPALNQVAVNQQTQLPFDKGDNPWMRNR